MASNFPTSLQDLDATRGTDTDALSSPNHVDHHALEDDTIEALQAKVGVDSSAVTTSLDYLLTNASSEDPGHTHTNSSVTLSIDDLSDVNITSATDGNGIFYNSTTSMWENTDTSVVDADETTKGVTKLSVAPAAGSNPIAVGTNDNRVPSQDENDALVGSSGTPSSSNKYATEDTITGLASTYGKITVVNEYTSNDTWNKGSGAVKVFVQLWGGGASGAKNSGGVGGGGGGGAYTEMWFDAADLGSSESVTVGAGGAAQSSNGNGVDGGNSSFGSHVTAYGGQNGASAGDGGGGGGITSAGSGTTGGSPFPGATTIFGGGTGGSAGNGGASVYGGGGGADGNNTGGSSVYGGAGGGGGDSNGTGGTSTYGGNGGDDGAAGTAPGGGGGGSISTDSGAGGAGKVIVTTFF